MKVICLLGENATLSTLNKVKADSGFQNLLSLLLFVPIIKGDDTKSILE